MSNPWSCSPGLPHHPELRFLGHISTCPPDTFLSTLTWAASLTPAASNSSVAHLTPLTCLSCDSANCQGSTESQATTKFFSKFQDLFILKEKKTHPRIQHLHSIRLLLSLNMHGTHFHSQVLPMADVTLKHQTMRSHCAAMNASTEVNGTRFPAPILLCGRGFSTVTFLQHLRSAKHCPFQDALEQILTDIFQMHGILNAIPIFSFGLAKSQAVLQFLSIYLRLVHSSSLFYSATLPQDTTRTALDPASTGFIHEEARKHR